MRVTALLDFARHLNSIARSVLEEDSEHAAMFFLGFDGGDVEVRQFEEVFERPVGQSRAREMADAVRGSSATLIAFVSEAWSAPEEMIPPGARPGDAPEAHDVLLLAALDRRGKTVTLETPISRRHDGALNLGETVEANAAQVSVFDDVRRVWGLGSL